MVKKGKNFSGNVTPLFDSMLVKPTKDEGEVSERPPESQPIPSPTHPSADQPEPQSDLSPRPSSSIPILDSIPEGSGGNHRVANIKDLKAQIKQLKKKARTIINHHKAWMKSLSMKKRLARKKKMESVSKQGRKTFKSEPTVHKDPAFDDLDDAMDYMETEDAHDEGTVKDSEEKRVSTEDQVSTTQPQPKVSTDKPKVSIDKLDEGNDELNEGTLLSQEDEIQMKVRAAPTTVFRDDETIAQFLVTMSQNKTKQKGVKIKEIKDTDRPRTTTERSILTLKPLLKIDPKDKGKKVLEEKAESEGVNEVERKFAQLANDEEVARKVQEEWEAEEEKKKLAEEEATKSAFTNEYDYIQARLNADEILAEKLQVEEREKFTIEQRAKLLHDTIVVQRRFLAQQRSEAIRNKFPSRNQLRNQMMTYSKHEGGYKQAQLNKNKFEEIQTLYERQKKFDQSFIPIDSAEDERQIRETNKKTAETNTSKKIKSYTAINYEVLQTRFPIIEWESKFYDYGHYGRELIYYRVIRADGSSRWIKTFSEMVKLFDRMDLVEIHSLVMKRFATTTPEGIDLLLWGDLKTMFESNTDDELWKNQEEWNLLSWEFHENCRVHVLRLEDGTEINMLAGFGEEAIVELEKSEDIKNWLVQKQTASGKDFSNPFMVGNLPKTVWLSIHLVVYNEELVIPEQTATGKGISNSKNLKENQGCRVDTNQVHQNVDLKNRSVWIHPPGLQDVYTKET
ncbi:hypothetical protein Tco_1099108 [Tanacetum coccineum]